MTLTELRDALKKATGPDRALDHHIHWLHQTGDPSEPQGWVPVRLQGNLAPAYTASLDAAATLVPPKWRLRNMQQNDPASRYTPCQAELIPVSDDDAAWAVLELAPAGRILGQHPTSLPIAICLARLEFELAKAPTPDAATGEAE